VGSGNTRTSPTDTIPQERRPYSKPMLTGFGLIRDLTANGSGVMDEQPSDCSANKTFTPIAMCPKATSPSRTRGG
jgi:hypothetical protein